MTFSITTFRKTTLSMMTLSIKQNDIQHGDTHNKGLIWDTQHTPYRVPLCCRHFAKCPILFNVLLTVIKLSIVAPVQMVRPGKPY
jgi:hypothetical protein